MNSRELPLWFMVVERGHLRHLASRCYKPCVRFSVRLARRAKRSRILAAGKPMTSHLVLIADGSGDVAIAERAPGIDMHVRRGSSHRVALTNHFEGPLAPDPANLAVRAHTSTLARRARLDELLNELPPSAPIPNGSWTSCVTGRALAART